MATLEAQTSLNQPIPKAWSLRDGLQRKTNDPDPDRWSFKYKTVSTVKGSLGLRQMLFVYRSQILQTEAFKTQVSTLPTIVVANPANTGCARRYPICTREAERLLPFDGGVQVADDEAVAVRAGEQVHLEDRVARTRLTVRIICTFQFNAMRTSAVYS